MTCMDSQLGAVTKTHARILSPHQPEDGKFMLGAVPDEPKLCRSTTGLLFRARPDCAGGGSSKLDSFAKWRGPRASLTKRRTL